MTAPLPTSPSRLRVIQAVNVRWHNATAWYGLTLARLLADAGHESLVLVPPGTECHDRALELGLRVATPELNAKSPAALARLPGQIARLLANFRPHVVNCHRGESFWLWSLFHAAPWRRGKDGFALIRTRGDQRLVRNDVFNRLLHRRADGVIASNSRILTRFRDELRVPGDRLALVMGGVDRAAFAPDPAGRARVRAELGLSDETPLVGLLGRYDHVKGQVELMRSLAEVPGARLFLIGFDTTLTEADMRAAAQAAGVADRAVLSGRRGDVAACLSACDLAVVNSQGSEAIARAALEFMACGVPLVSTDVGVMPDLLAPEALAPVGDEPAMARLLARGLADTAFRNRLKTGQARVMTELGLDSFLDKTLAVYRSALKRRALAHGGA